MTSATSTHQPRIERMTGLAGDQVSDLVARVAAYGLWPLRRRRALDLRQSVTVVLLYLRHNLSQPLLAELSGCSQPTISRLITRLIPILTEVLTATAQATAERELRSTVRVDGFLVPVGDRRKTPTPQACTPANATAADSTSRWSRPGTAGWS